MNANFSNQNHNFFLRIHAIKTIVDPKIIHPWDKWPQAFSFPLCLHGLSISCHQLKISCLKSGKAKWWRDNTATSSLTSLRFIQNEHNLSYILSVKPRLINVLVCGCSKLPLNRCLNVWTSKESGLFFTDIFPPY